MKAETPKAGTGLMRDFVHLDHRDATLVADWVLSQIPELARSRP